MGKSHSQFGPSQVDFRLEMASLRLQHQPQAKKRFVVLREFSFSYVSFFILLTISPCEGYFRAFPAEASKEGCTFFDPPPKTPNYVPV